jgi:hypothetical protein
MKRATADVPFWHTLAGGERQTAGDLMDRRMLGAL